MLALIPAVFIGLLGLIVVVALWAIGVYNRLVKLKVRCEDAWASIDVQLKRRYDLIPNLVETVKGYASHERETLEAVIAARQAGVDAGSVQEQAQAENLITGALRQMFALSEAYPDLKANTNFAQLQEELSTTENKISFARQNYNSNVTNYNTRIESFPDNLLAGVFSFDRRDFFELEDAEQREAPQVQF
ncbi:MAG: LemA family protein [Acidobacteria bacterium]|nr:LemA family protein [Acidobacteriota bacterium]